MTSISFARRFVIANRLLSPHWSPASPCRHRSRAGVWLGCYLGWLLSLVPALVRAQDPAAFAASYAAEAKADYATAIASLRAGYAGTYEQNLRLGWLYYLAKDYSAAATYYQQAVTQRPAALEAKFGLLKPLSALGQVDHMLRLYTDILRIDPQNTQANYWTGVLHLNRRAYAQALPCFERVVNLYPFDYDANLALATTYHNLGRRADARTLYARLLLIRPADATATAGLRQP